MNSEPKNSNVVKLSRVERFGDCRAVRPDLFRRILDYTPVCWMAKKAVDCNPRNLPGSYSVEPWQPGAMHGELTS